MDTTSEDRIYIQRLDITNLNTGIASLDILRLDPIHPVVSGNKWFKLKENIKAALAGEYASLLTFGGAYSNHLVATAAAANEAGLKSVGLVRGLYAARNPSETLQQCAALGMHLHFVSRQEYDRKYDEAYLQYLTNLYPASYIIPEGGANEAGRVGASAIAGIIPHGHTHVCLSVGTGTTLCGIRRALPASVQVIGFAPLKGGRYIADDISRHLHSDLQFTIIDDFHFGGFGKWNSDLISFMNRCHQQHNLPLDIIYTSKMMYGIESLLTTGYFPAGARILCIHTGGLQGNSSVGHLLSF